MPVRWPSRLIRLTVARRFGFFIRRRLMEMIPGVFQDKDLDGESGTWLWKKAG